MKVRLVTAICLFVSLAAAATAQDASGPPQAGQNDGSGSGRGPGGGYARRGGGGMGMGMGRGLTGEVTAVAADRYTVKTDAGDVYTIRFSANTRFFKQPPGMGMRGQAGSSASPAAGQNGAPGQNAGPGQNGGLGQGAGMRANPPQEIKATDIKVGDSVAVMGETDAATKTVGAVIVAVVDPQRAQQMREMQANFGKTWLAGKVTAIDDAKITLTGAVDNASHTVVADENTTFRKRRDPVTLADIQVGDTVRVDGALKDGAFTATAVTVTGMPSGENPTVPRNAPPQ